MNSNYCICCGEEIPEGRDVCPVCADGKRKNVDARKKHNYFDDEPSYEPSRYRRKQKPGRKK